VPDPALLIAAAALAAATPVAARQTAPGGQTIHAEFRVFDGTNEVSTTTRLRVRPSGSTETGTVVESGTELAVDLPAGIYDVQAVRQESGRAVSVRWAERLIIMAYPDEGGRHLEVINFSNQFGALQLRWSGPAPDASGAAVTISRPGDTRPMSTRLIRGAGYMLIVVPAGTYDVRITQPGRSDVTLTAVEVPADRTRMKLIQ
jgi:hypothetical protein